MLNKASNGWKKRPLFEVLDLPLVTVYIIASGGAAFRRTLKSMTTNTELLKTLDVLSHAHCHGIFTSEKLHLTYYLWRAVTASIC